MSANGGKVSPYAAPAAEKDESASAKLMEAKRAGHQVRMRISGTAGGIGCTSTSTPRASISRMVATSASTTAALGCARTDEA